MHKHLPSVIFVTASLLIAQLAAAPTLYRYKDAKGETVLDTTVPPEYVKNGYEVLNQGGLVIKVIPPAPTEAQLLEKQRQLEVEAEKQEQRDKDRELLRLYSHPDEIIVLWQRRVDDIGSFIKLKTDNIEIQKKKLDDLLSKAANLQRAGKTVDDGLVNNMTLIEDKITAMENEIANSRIDIDMESLEFQRKMDRLIELTDRYPTLPLPGG